MSRRPRRRSISQMGTDGRTDGRAGADDGGGEGRIRRTGRVSARTIDARAGNASATPPTKKGRGREKISGAERTLAMTMNRPTDRTAE